MHDCPRLACMSNSNCGVCMALNIVIDFVVVLVSQVHDVLKIIIIIKILIKEMASHGQVRAKFPNISLRKQTEYTWSSPSVWRWARRRKFPEKTSHGSLD